MKKALLFLAITIPVLSAQNITLSFPAPEFSHRFDDIYVSSTNNNTAWAVSLGEGFVIKTIDGGSSWDTIFDPLDGCCFRSVDFLNDSIGFVSSIDSSFYRTTDGGNNWTEIPNTTFAPNFSGVCGMAHYNNTLYGVGFWGGSPLLIKSTDSGNSWITHDMSMYADGLVDVLCLSENEIIVSGQKDNAQHGIILKSVDGGNSFNQVFQAEESIYMTYGWKLFLVEGSNTVFSAIENTGSDSLFIAKSTDLGNTWTQIYVGPNYNISEMQGIGFLDQNVGFLGGWGSGFYRTNDGGNNWVYVNLIYTSPYGPFMLRNINRFYKISSNEMYIAGADIYKIQINDLSVSTESSTTPFKPIHQNSSYNLKISPNPAESYITISYELKSKTNISLYLHDVNGKHIDKISSANQSPGEYMVNYFVEKLSPGEYIIYAMGDAYHDAIRFVKK
jgi:photosystem II stability/assembly factor-like uncharacterized protein